MLDSLMFIYNPILSDHYCDDPMQSMNFMLSGSNYQQPILRGDIDDSPDSDDSSGTFQ